MRPLILAVVVLLAATQALAETYLRPCYFTNWAHYRPDPFKYFPENYVPGLCTHILFAFGWIDGQTFKAKHHDDQDLPTDWAGPGMYNRVNKLKESDPGLKTLLSFGGWSFGTDIFKRLAASQQNRKVFIDSAFAFIEKYGFDGIDIDWEYPEASDKDNYLELVKELQAAAVQRSGQNGKEKVLITAAVTPNVEKIDAGYHVKELSKHFDFILLMTYDFHGKWDKNTGINAPLYAKDGDPFSVEVAANHWSLRGMPKKMIALGIATYGRGWTLDNPSNTQVGAPGSQGAEMLPFSREGGMGAYYEFCDMLRNGAERHWDDKSKTPYLTKGNQWFSYDDEESVEIKLDWVIKNGFGGAFTWTLDFDDFNGKCAGKAYPIHSVIAKKLTGSNVVPEHPATTMGPVVNTRQPPRRTTKAPAGTKAPAVTKAPTGTKAPVGFSCQEDGFFPDPESCSRFYRCVSGTAYKFDCPGGTQFNKKTKECDHSSAVNCRR